MPVCMFKDTVLTGLSGGTASSAVYDSLLPTKVEPFFFAQCTHQVFVPIKKCLKKEIPEAALSIKPSTADFQKIYNYAVFVFVKKKEEEKWLFLSEVWRLIDKSQQVELDRNQNGTYLDCIWVAAT